MKKSEKWNGSDFESETRKESRRNKKDYDENGYSHHRRKKSGKRIHREKTLKEALWEEFISKDK